MENKQKFIALCEKTLPLEGIEQLGSEMMYIVGGDTPPVSGSGSGCGCGCSSGAGCGCGCSTGAGCGCNC